MTLVYRYYDQTELERQLNARATVPDITPILARYASESARVRASLPCRLAVSYGASEPERLDIFPAATSGLSPIAASRRRGPSRTIRFGARRRIERSQTAGKGDRDG